MTRICLGSFQTTWSYGNRHGVGLYLIVVFSREQSSDMTNFLSPQVTRYVRDFTPFTGSRP